jgi:cytoskeletal protein CcmA (bactofilin family)
LNLLVLDTSGGGRYDGQAETEGAMAEVRIKDLDEHEIDTILADDIDFEGHLTFKKPLMIKGKFKGEIRSESALYVGEKALVEAKIESGLVSSRGRINGDITGHARVELASTAQVDGDIQTPDFVVESGCKFNGHCNMTGQKRAPHQQPQGQAPVQNQGQNQPHQGQPQGQQQNQRPQGQQQQNQRPPGQQPQGQQQNPQQQNPQQQNPRPQGQQNQANQQNPQGGNR